MLLITKILLSTPITEELLSGRVDVNNLGFIFLLFCFFTNVYFLRVNPRLPLLMLDGFVHSKDRRSIFYETSGYELINKILLLFQTIILLSLSVYVGKVHYSADFTESGSRLFSVLGVSSLLLLSFLIYKHLSYTFIGLTFFRKEQTRQWNDIFLNINCLLGIVLFLPVLLLFFSDSLTVYALYFVIFLLFIALFVTIYSYYRVFFYKKDTSLHFILYLCAQEIIPLYLLSKGFGYFL